jgi:hypothetical protein
VSSTAAISLVEQRHDLRRRLQAQRRLIAQQLGPDPRMGDSYPRSRTMRFLTQQPVLRLLTQQPTLIIRLLVGLATLLKTK